MAVGRFTKDPDAKLDYAIDWSPWLAEGETISISTWEVPDGLTNENQSNTDTAATVWILGGTPGEHYEVTNRVTTSAGRIDDRTILLFCSEQ